MKLKLGREQSIRFVSVKPFWFQSLILLSLLVCCSFRLEAARIARIAIFNDDTQALSLSCLLGDNIQHHFMKNKQFNITIRANDHKAIDLVGPDEFEHVWLTCMGNSEQAKDSVFAYRSATHTFTMGRFHFDPAYDGAFIFE